MRCAEQPSFNASNQGIDNDCSLALPPTLLFSPCLLHSDARVGAQVVPLSEVGSEHHDSPDGVHQEGAGRRKRDHSGVGQEQELYSGVGQEQELYIGVGEEQELYSGVVQEQEL